MTVDEVHPTMLWPRICRRLRGFDRFRGWRRIANTSSTADFTVVNNGVAFAGSLGSHVDRSVYLYGGYETEMIGLFVSALSAGRRGTVLDVGGNVGTHSVAFAGAFANVHTFEPNEKVWPSFERNMSLNAFSNVTLHKIGLSDADAELTFYNVTSDNQGMGTFSAADQYDIPIEEVGVLPVRLGDGYLAEQGIDAVDAIKIDVQGFEPNVLRGLQATLTRDRPVIWVEIGDATREAIDTADDLAALVPYTAKISRMTTQGWVRRVVTEEVAGRLRTGNYLVVPR